MKQQGTAATGLFWLFGTLTTTAVFLYSYTQVDLNLTLSRVSIWQTIQKGFQHIGYFDRPLSLWLFLGMLLLMAIWYGIALVAASRNLLSRKALWIAICLMSLVLVFSYPAFSYDLFNHMFTAKTVLLYGKNPYTVTPLQFMGYESWLTFMRWTHVVSIYSPLWIGMTLVPYLMGFGYFLLIMWNFKLLIALFYLLAVWAIGRILDTDDPKHSTLGMTLFALNPLVVIESLVSSHNDIVMMGFAMVFLLFLYRKGMVSSLFMLSLSIASKLMTVALAPMYVFGNRKWLPPVLMAAAGSAFLLVTKREIMPWYALWILPFTALHPRLWRLQIVLFGWSMGLILRYGPFLYYGHWDNPVPEIKWWVTLVPVGIALVLAALVRPGKAQVPNSSGRRLAAGRKGRV